jgi:glycine cleavage system H protein
MASIGGFDFPDELFYDAQEHLWVRPAGDGLVTVGIDDGGQDALGDVVYVQLAEPGRKVARGDAIGSVEAEKMVRPLLAPVSGTIRVGNTALVAAPRPINTDPYGAWLFRIGASDWENEKTRLLHGTEAVRAWVSAELLAHGKA